MPDDLFTIAVITDLHGTGSSEIPERRGEIADLLLRNVVEELNNRYRPDVTVALGDIVDSGDSEEATEWLERLRSIFEGLQSPLIAIPGNHDPIPDSFYRFFEKPSPVTDFGGVRILSFIDPARPGYNAERSERDLQRFAEARKGFDGTIVALQHVCLFPNGAADIPYNYIDSARIIDEMNAAGVSLSLSGHYHRGSAPISERGVTFAIIPAICESPHPYALVRLIGRGKSPTIAVERRVALPGDQSMAVTPE